MGLLFLKQIITTLDRDVANIKWSSDNKGIYFNYDDMGNTWIDYTDLNGTMTKLSANLGGLMLDRPYSLGSFTVSANGRFVFTFSGTDHPSDLASGSRNNTEIKRITSVNDDLFLHKELGKVEE